MLDAASKDKKANTNPLASQRETKENKRCQIVVLHGLEWDPRLFAYYSASAAITEQQICIKQQMCAAEACT